ncbi:MAG: CvpA family protein [Candidatus Omnitrophica bacterium]|nr:CvpA family protein [Candidatus Omnitrophota bacterium]
MIFNVLKNFNWLDICILIIIFRVLYIAIKNGFTAELFKFFGIICAIYLSMHYYTAITDFIRGKIPVEEKMPLEFLDFLIFLILALTGNFLFVLLRNAVNNLIKIEAVSTLNKWGGLFLGALRSVLLASIIVFALTISSIPYFKQSVKRSYIGPRIISVGVDTYSWLWNSIFSRFLASERVNRIVLEVKEGVISK